MQPDSPALDPVCRMTVDPQTAPAQMEYQGKTYYFCNPHCLTRFQADPQKYLSGKKEPMSLSLAPQAADRIAIEAGKVSKSPLDSLAGCGDGRSRIPMRSADRLRDDLVNNAEPQHVVGGDFHVGGSVLRLRGVEQPLQRIQLFAQ